MAQKKKNDSASAICVIMVKSVELQQLSAGSYSIPWQAEILVPRF